MVDKTKGITTKLFKSNGILNGDVLEIIRGCCSKF